jgi:hypothetical protein
MEISWKYDGLVWEYHGYGSDMINHRINGMICQGYRGDIMDMTLLYDHIITCDHMSYDLDMIWISPEIGTAPPNKWPLNDRETDMIDQWMERGGFTCPIFTPSHIYKNGRSSPYPWI